LSRLTLSGQLLRGGKRCAPEEAPPDRRLCARAEDEKKHEEMFREMIGSYLDGVPSMGIAETHPASTVNKILEVNLKDEKHAVDIYLGIMKKIHDMKD